MNIRNKMERLWLEIAKPSQEAADGAIDIYVRDDIWNILREPVLIEIRGNVSDEVRADVYKKIREQFLIL